MDNQEHFLKRVRELAEMAYQRDIVTFTPFLNLNELHMVNSLQLRGSGVRPEAFGGYDFAERQMVAFIPDALSYDFNFPLECIQITCKGAKFSAKLTHRDYLGALIHLGIDRSALGDILVCREDAFLFCQEHMADYILKNLSRVRHTTVLPQRIDDPTQLPRPELEPVTGTVSSLRLDSILAVAFKTSRSSLVQNIESGNVFVNGRMVTSNGYTLKEGDIISLRGKGKFQFVEAGGQSRKGRIFVRINRYV